MSPNTNRNKEDDDEHEESSIIRWRKGELIGCGAFGRVYMGMNLNSGELLAVKQVLITSSGASKEKAQAHVKELEEEVKLLKNLSHPNIVRYLGTAREDEALNILLEFVPGGSISSLIGKFGSFPESVIRMYTKQLLLGLEYLHKNGIMHRDIKGANILVDNKGCIKLADFGASKKVVELATMTGAKSMKGTPYWMAPEVILQTGHNFSADIWSVGCTVIEMATGKPPWCQYQEVAALFHIGTTKSPPPIPEHLSADAKDFLNKCLLTEANSRASASELLQVISSPEVGRSDTELFSEEDCGTAQASCNGESKFTFPCEPLADDDEEVTESKIRAFLDEKALDLKKLQEEFYNTLNSASPKAFEAVDGDAPSNLPTMSKSPSKSLSNVADVSKNASPVSHNKAVSDNNPSEQPIKEVPEIRELQKEGFIASPSFAERQRIWKEELDKELEMERERLRQAGGKTSSPIKRVPSQYRDRPPFASPPK